MSLNTKLNRFTTQPLLLFKFVVAEGDPENYLTFFKRGTVYLALGKAKLAISDLDRVIQLKPDFTAVSIVQKRKHIYKIPYFKLDWLILPIRPLKK